MVSVSITDRAGNRAAAFSGVQADTGTATVADLALFRSFHTRMVKTTGYKQWATSTIAGKADAAKYLQYAAAVLNGQKPPRPTVQTTFGNALLDAADMGKNG